MLKSFNACWRRLACEIPCSSTAWTEQRPQPVSRGRTDRPGSGLDQSILDQQRVRGVADSTLRSYAHDLLHFLRWWAAAHQTSAITEEALTESTLLDYIRFQVNQNPPPAAQASTVE